MLVPVRSKLGEGHVESEDIRGVYLAGIVVQYAAVASALLVEGSPVTMRRMLADLIDMIYTFGEEVGCGRADVIGEITQLTVDYGSYCDQVATV